MSHFVHIAVFFLTLVALCAHPDTARAADVYVAFDEQGLAQFAERPLDPRYQLLFKDLRSAEPGKVAGVVAPAALRAELQQAAAKHGLDYALLHAVVQVESGFDAAAVSPKGAIGLMQLMPDTARRYGVHGDDAATLAERLRLPPVNVEAGSRYLSALLRRYDGDTELALAAYNAGEGAVLRAGNRVPDYPETRDYVRKVMTSLGRTGSTTSASTPAVPTAATSARLQRVDATHPSRAGAASVQVYRGENSAIERFERGFASPLATDSP